MWDSQAWGPSPRRLVIQSPKGPRQSRISSRKASCYIPQGWFFSETQPLLIPNAVYPKEVTPFPRHGNFQQAGKTSACLRASSQASQRCSVGRDSEAGPPERVISERFSVSYCLPTPLCSGVSPHQPLAVRGAQGKRPASHRCLCNLFLQDDSLAWTVWGGEAGMQVRRQQ